MKRSDKIKVIAWLTVQRDEIECTIKEVLEVCEEFSKEHNGITRLQETVDELTRLINTLDKEIEKEDRRKCFK